MKSTLISATLLLTALTLSAGALVGDTNENHRISLAQWSLHRNLWSAELDNLDFPRVAAEKFGIFHIEWVSQFFQDKAEDRAYLQQMKDQCDRYGVQSLLIMVDGEGNLGAPDPDERMQAVANHRKWIDAAAFLGAYAIRVNGNGLGDPGDIHKALVTSLRELSDIAAEENISILVENHGMRKPDVGWTADVPSTNGAWLAGVLAAVDRPNVGALPDFGNFYEYDRYQGVEDLLPYAHGISAKTNLFDDQGEETQTSFKRMFDLINASGFDGHIGVEYEGPDDSGLTEYQGIQKTIDLIKRYFQPAPSLE
jgi:sugar phosphate isomerase/epimerase